MNDAARDRHGRQCGFRLERCPDPNEHRTAYLGVLPAFVTGDEGDDGEAILIANVVIHHARQAGMSVNDWLSYQRAEVAHRPAPLAPRGAGYQRTVTFEVWRSPEFTALRPLRPTLVETFSEICPIEPQLGDRLVRNRPDGEHHFVVSSRRVHVGETGAQLVVEVNEIEKDSRR